MTHLPESILFTRTWMGLGSLCGVLGIASYLIAAFAPLPDKLSYAAAFAFGPLLAIGMTGLAHGLALERTSPRQSIRLSIARGFANAACFILLTMLTTQQAIFSVLKTARAATADANQLAVYQQIGTSLNAVHFGMDVAWDVLISVAVMLFGIAMWQHPRFGRIAGGLGILLGGLLLIFNLRYFPVPPADSNSIDWGPFVALWMLAAFILLGHASRYVQENVIAASQSV